MANKMKILEDSNMRNNISTISMNIKKRQNISKYSDAKYGSKISKMLQDLAPNMEQKRASEKRRMEQITEGVLEGFDNKMEGLCESHAKERKKCVENLEHKMSPVLDELQQQLAVIAQTGTKLLETVDQQLAEIKTVRETNMVKMAALRYMHSSFKQILSEKEQNQMNEFVSVHQSTEDDITKLHNKMAEMMEIEEMAA